MSKILLNKDTEIDLPKLIDSRLLIQANSGGGKSWAIRRIIEQAVGKVQIIVLDPEGEFTNLREKFDFVYAGKGGDAPVESRSAALLAHRLLELKASAIIDLYELPPQERKHFVRLFCEAMVNAPKELWHDVLVIIDEAHVFAPEKGESEAMGPVIDLATRGRKRGYCVVLATQRLPKLNKDAAAECNNKLIGRASQDIDRKRASEELGFTTKESVLSLRDLDPGEFYAFGPAISREVIKVTIGDVEVKPPPRSQSKVAPSAPSAAVKKILGKLADLPQEAQKEATTIAELKQQVKILTHQLRTRAVEKVPQEKTKLVEVFVLKNNQIERLEKVATSILSAVQSAKQKPITAPVVVKPVIQQRAIPSKSEVTTNEFDVTGPEQRILNAIAWMESIGISAPIATAVAFLSGYTFGGGGFNNPRGALRTKGLIQYQGNALILTEQGRALAKIPDIPLSTEELHRHVMQVLPGPEQKLLNPLLEAYPNDLSNEELAQLSGYTNGSGGFNNPKGRLRTLGLVEYPTGGRVKASSLLFLD